MSAERGQKRFLFICEREKTNNHDENPPRKTKTKDDPNKKEQDSHNGKHLDMNKELLKKEDVKIMRHEFG